MDKMIPSRSSKKRVDATAPAKGTDAEGGSTGDGEGFGVGTKHSATLNERANKSINRNSGPERPSANSGMIATPSMGSRKTGRV